MSDGAIGRSHVTIPDLLEPVVGFRRFRVDIGQPAKEAWEETKYVTTAGRPGRPYSPFIEPNDFVVDPVSGKLVRDYIKVAEAFRKWQDSLGERQIVHHPAEPATGSHLSSPTYSGHMWSPEVNVARCGQPAGHVANVDHHAPEADCECGLYSYYDPSKASPGALMVMGIVTSWGQIEAHPTGMRSEYMQIHALLGGPILDHLGSEWGDVVMLNSSETTLEEFASLASEFGSPLPETMRPKRSREDVLAELYTQGALTRKTKTLPKPGTRVYMGIDPATPGSVVWYNPHNPHDTYPYPPRPIYASSRTGTTEGDRLYWFISLLALCVPLLCGFIILSAREDPAVRSTPPAHIRQYKPPASVFEAPLSAPANSLVRPVGGDDG